MKYPKEYLDEIDEAVNIIGACNTVVNNKGKLKGYNTDWGGVLNFIKTHGSKVLPSSEWSDPYPDDTDADYWRQSYNNRGAMNRILFDPTASDTRPVISGVNITGISFQQT